MGGLCQSLSAPGRMVGPGWVLPRRMRATKRSGRQGHGEQRWLCAPQCGHPHCWGCHGFTGGSLEAGQDLGEEIQRAPQLSSAWLGGAAGWDTHTQMATRQTVGLGFQATLFTTPPTGRVFMQRAVHTSQNRTVPSSEPAGQDGVGRGQDQARLGGCHGSARPHAKWGGAAPRSPPPPAPPLLAAFGEELWEQQEGGSNALAPASPQQLLGTTAAPAPRRRDVTGGCCRENRPPSRSLPPHGSARGPPPDVRGSGRSCRAGSVPGSARRGAAPSRCEVQAAAPRAGSSTGRRGGSR